MLIGGQSSYIFYYIPYLKDTGSPLLSPMSFVSFGPSTALLLQTSLSLDLDL